MKLHWVYDKDIPVMVKTFLREKGISKRLLAQIKQAGTIKVNGIEQIVLVYLQNGDQIDVVIPDEGEHETTKESHIPIEVLFEDEFFLVVNKPSGTASIPSKLHPDLSMANRVKGYYARQGYANRIPHVVTRLDRDTSGIMLFAKHRLSHAWMDQQLRKKQIKKYYTAIIQALSPLEEHGMIDYPIGRDGDSIITRTVKEDGKPSLTEYWVQQSFEQDQVVKILLHTGRTHQIRVHFSHIGAPLIGDDLYGGPIQDPLFRQALHCKELEFVHPMTNQTLSIVAPMPNDMQQWINQKLSTTPKEEV